MTASLNVALIGYGYAGRVFHAPLITASRGLNLARVTSSRPGDVMANLPHVRVSSSLTETLDDATIDLVVIATPNAMHATQAHAALDAGKHVVVDKPFTVTVEEAESVGAHAERAGRVLSVFHNRRWDSDFLTLRSLLESGTLGEVRYFESRFDRFRPVVRDRWRERSGPGAGLWYDLGPHLIDQALQLFGAPQGIEVDRAILREGAEVDDYFHATLRYAHRRVVLHATMLAAAHDTRFVVHGTRGSYTKSGLDTQEEALKIGRTPGDATWGHDPRDGVLTVVDGSEAIARTVPNERGSYLRYYEGVRDAIQLGASNPVGWRDGLAVMRLLEGMAGSNASP